MAGATGSGRSDISSRSPSPTGGELSTGDIRRASRVAAQPPRASGLLAASLPALASRAPDFMSARTAALGQIQQRSAAALPARRRATKLIHISQKPGIGEYLGQREDVQLKSGRIVNLYVIKNRSITGSEFKGYTFQGVKFINVKFHSCDFSGSWIDRRFIGEVTCIDCTTDENTGFLDSRTPERIQERSQRQRAIAGQKRPKPQTTPRTKAGREQAKAAEEVATGRQTPISKYFSARRVAGGGAIPRSPKRPR